MQERIITLATPVFFALIALELLWGWLRRRNTYRINDALTSIGLGVMSQATGVFTRVLRVGIYAATFDAIALARWPTGTLWALPAALIFYDFCYYWHHRWMHEIAIAWAAHVVHHSSEDYNLSTALRQTSSGALLGWIPYVPMAVAGVPPQLFAAVALVQLLYQYWIHTEQIGRLGWFDRVFASPSNHRVHHAVNDRYIDRNYGGILILWDRMFGTFQDERADEPPRYGTRAPLRSFNPLWANLEVYARLARDAWRTRRWTDKFALWVRRPGWRPADLLEADAPRLEHPPGPRRFDPPLSTRVAAYAMTQFAITLACAIHFLQVQAYAPAAQTAGYLAFIVASLAGIGGLLEGRRAWAATEIARMLFVIAFVLGTGRWFGTEALAQPARWAIVTIAALSIPAVLAALRHTAPANRAAAQAG
jgi:alkylglycerol monooxygenase